MASDFVIRVDTSQIEALAQLFPVARSAIDYKVRRTLALIMELLLNIAVDITVTKDLVNSGQYLNSLTTEVRGTRTNFRGILTPGAAHGYYVEHGRRPGKAPPPDAIQLWVRRKLGINDDREVKSVAFLIGRAIAERGTIKRFGYGGGDVLKDTLTRGRPQVERLWREMGHNLAREIMQVLSAAGT